MLTQCTLLVMCHQEQTFHFYPPWQKTALKQNHFGGHDEASWIISRMCVWVPVCEWEWRGVKELMIKQLYDVHSVWFYIRAVSSWFSNWLAFSVCFFLIQKLFVIVAFSRHIVKQMVSLTGWVSLNRCVFICVCLFTKSTLWGAVITHESYCRNLTAEGYFERLWHWCDFCENYSSSSLLMCWLFHRLRGDFVWVISEDDFLFDPVWSLLCRLWNGGFIFPFWLLSLL